MSRHNWQKIIHDTYVELYKNAEPSVDFDELVKNAVINDRGEKAIPFDNYEMSMASMDSIIDGFQRRHKMNKHDGGMYSAAIYLGCSPKTKVC